MFGRIILTQLKFSFRSRKYIFWTLAFPIALGTLFYFAFNSIYSNNQNSPIPVVIEVTEDALNEYRVMEAFSHLDTDKISEDMKEYNESKAVAEAMGQDFTEEEPISEETLEHIEEVQSFEDMRDYNLDGFPYEYVTVDKSEIDAIEKQDLPFMEIISDLTFDDNKTKMIKEVEVSRHEEALQLLKDGDIAGIITISGLNDISLEVNGGGVKHSILSSIIATYRLQVQKAIDTINDAPDELGSADTVMDESTKSIDFVEAKGMAGNNKDPFVSYFYNLIAMISIMGSFGSLSSIASNCANQTTTGIRIDTAPINKVFYELAQVVALILAQGAISFITLTYLILILGIRFGGNLGLIYLTAFLASVMGVILGYMVSHLGKMPADKKETILMAITLGGGFLSGLMIGDMKIIIEEKFPLFNRINPSAVITDAFYAINIFGPGPRYYRSLMYMLILSAVMLVIGIILSRRTSYKSL